MMPKPEDLITKLSDQSLDEGMEIEDWIAWLENLQSVVRTEVAAAEEML